MLSGPAGGVVGYAATSYDKETCKPVIGFDMGGMIIYVQNPTGRHIDMIIDVSDACSQNKELYPQNMFTKHLF